MQVEGSTIIFKSDWEQFCKESSGVKPNTVRYIPENEETQYKLEYKTLKYSGLGPELHSGDTVIEYIFIKHHESGCSFTRQIQDVTIAELNGTKIYIFSWVHNMGYR